MAYQIVVHEPAAEEIAALRTFDQRHVVRAIEEQLSHQPTTPTRRRKLLTSVVPAFEHVLPVWELRVDEIRVFYDVEEMPAIVHIRAVRRKEPRQRTGDIV
jgi:mRNA-degrading endonuclease RelE of RelBE toxin-antitoxin system